jgi:hypothetical protein
MKLRRYITMNYWPERSASTRLLALTLAASLLLAGCATVPRSFFNEEADMSFYTRVGILPFKNLASDRFADEKIRSCLFTELLVANRFELLDPGEINSLVLQVTGERVPSGDFSLEHVGALAEKGGLQGFFEGVIREYQFIRAGQEQFPLISLSVRFVDAQTGKTVWSADLSRRGGPNLPFLSVGETHTLGELAQRVCRDLASDFVRKAY